MQLPIAVTPPSRFGVLQIKNNKVLKFLEKKILKRLFGKWWFFYFFKNKIFKFLKNDNTILEKKPLEKISKLG